MVEKQKITFSDLSTSLKIIMVGSGILVGIFAFYFCIAFTASIMGVPLE